METDYVGKDCRAFNLDELFIKELVCGHYKPFVDFVKSRPELELCFRKNSSNNGNVIIYYNNHIVWNLTFSYNKPVVEISIGHLRYEEDWRDVIENLIKNYEFKPKDIKVVKVDDDNNNSNSYTLNVTKISSKKAFSFDEIKHMYESCLKPMMESFFNEKCTTDYFLKEIGKTSDRKKNPLIEKKRQQQIFTANTNRDDGFYIYDLEFSQKFENQKLKNEYIKKCKETFGEDAKPNEPDMLSIYYKNGFPQSLVLIEVKSTESAMKGKSDIKKHMYGMKYYVETEINMTSLMENRKEEAYLAMCNYKELGLHNIGKREIEEEIKSIANTERFVVLTDEAAKYYYKNMNKINNLAIETGTKIIVLEGENMTISKDKVIRI